MAALAAAGAVPPARACDLCAIYTTSEAREDQTGFRVGLGEQFTYFHTLQKNGREVANPAGEKIASSITQFMFGYNVFPRFGVQLNVPVISRDYRRAVTSGIDDGNVTGFGDLSLIAIGKLLSWADLDSVAHVVAFAGVKLPSGSPSFLAEEQQGTQPPCIPFPDPTSCLQRVRVPPDLYGHHSTGPPSGVHGHDLTLGSGSVDGVIGAQAFASWQRAFATAFIQYMARNQGAYQYRFANDLLFGAGPGLYLATGDALFGEPYAFRAQALFSGETKGNDWVGETRLNDTGITSLYLGPQFAFGWGTHLAAEIAADLPVLLNNTNLQIVPDYRLRGGATWRF
ncbi:hypothetical protein KF840_18085 [bacterium]|nr:hypothetical protein [bacterium]